MAQKTVSPVVSCGISLARSEAAVERVVLAKLQWLRRRANLCNATLNTT